MFDTHAHYDNEQFEIDGKKRLEEMHIKEGVDYVLNAGCDIETSKKSIALAQAFSFVYASVGIHPHEADSVPDDYMEQLSILAKHEKVKAIGEIGLDYFYDNSPREVQKQVFEQQLQLAQTIGLPVIIHAREATKDTLDLLRAYKPKGIVHCFSGCAETAQELVKLGLYIGFTGVVTFKNANKIIKAVEVVPLDRILLETDCPYMAPEPMRGKRSDSSMIIYTAQKIAQIKQIDTQFLIHQTTQNAKSIYGI
ncbi:MAG: TatD family hydrolase [Oscillospiraceae bacterium]